MALNQPDYEREILLNELGRPRRRGAPGGGGSPREQGGIMGTATPRDQSASVDALRQEMSGLSAPAGEPAAAPTRDFGTFGQFGHGALDQSKIDAGHDSPKYRIARVLSHFDPKQGLTPEVIEALNAQGLGTFSSDNGQFLRVSGNVDPRFEGVLGADMVRNFTSGEGTRWGGWGSVGAEGPGVKPAPRAPMTGGMGAAPSSFAGASPVAEGGSVYQDTVQTLEDLERQILLQQLAPRRAQRRA